MTGTPVDIVRRVLSERFLGKAVISPFAVCAKVSNGKIIYAQFMEDSFATARWFRSGGAGTQADVNAANQALARTASGPRRSSPLS